MKDHEIEAAVKKAGGRWDGSRWVFEDADLHPFARALLAAERERWAAPVQALLAAHDAGLMRVGEMMRAQGLTTMLIGNEAQAELDAIAVLRGLVGPNCRFKRTPARRPLNPALGINR